MAASFPPTGTTQYNAIQAKWLQYQPSVWLCPLQGIGVPVFEMGTNASPVEIARAGVEEGKRMKVDAIIVDTAGRLQIDEEMMTELTDTKAAIKPTDTLLVVDAMTGQEAANLVKAFNDQADITGECPEEEAAGAWRRGQARQC